MSLFDKLGGPARPPQQMDPRQMQQQMQQDVSDIKTHPASFLKARGMNIPDGMTDAQQITQYLLRTGQIGAPRLQQVMRMFGK